MGVRLVVCCMTVAVVVFSASVTSLPVGTTRVVISAAVTVGVVVEGVVMVTVVSWRLSLVTVSWLVV